MTKKSGFMFTSKKISYRGVMSSILGFLSFISIIVSVAISFLNRGDTPFRVGIAGIFALFMAMAGLGLAIVGMTKTEEFQLFPRMGFAVNILTLFLWVGIIYFGII